MRTKGTPKTGGRIKGSNNKITADLKLKMTNFLNANFDKFTEDMESIDDPYQKAKLFLDVCKIVMPKPREEEVVEEENKFNSELMRKLFPNREQS